jgi:hypothetical protein
MATSHSGPFRQSWGRVAHLAGAHGRRLGAIAALTGAVLLAGLSTATAKISDGKVKIGLPGDQSGMASDVSGKGTILAAPMAIEDFGGTVRRSPIELVDAAAKAPSESRYPWDYDRSSAAFRPIRPFAPEVEDGCPR